MGWLTELQRPLNPVAVRHTQPNTEFSGERIVWFPSKDLGGIRMTPDDALRLSAVWACVTVISKAIASSDWDVFLQLDNGDRIPRRRLQTYTLLNDSPNPECAAFGFMEAMYIQALTWGNFYAEIEMDRGGRPVALWALAPERCTLEREPDGRLVLVVRNRGKTEAVLDYVTEVFHVHGPGIDGISGFETITMAARSLAHAAAAERFGQSFYHNNTQLGGLLSTDQKLNEDARKATKEALEDGRKGSANAFGLLTLDSGFKYTPMGVDPEKGQFIETRYLLIEEVCRIFGVPPHKVAHLLRATFSNIEEQSIEFVRDALTPWAERAAQEVNRKLLRPWPGIRSRVDLEWAAEGNAKSKADTDAVLVSNGIINRNEARKRRGLNSMGPDGEKFTVQVNMTTIEKIGADMPAPDDSDEAAAVALFHMAALRTQRRRQHAAGKLAEQAGDSDAYRAALEGDLKEHARYAGAQFGQALDVLKVDVDRETMKAELIRWFDEETALLVAAFGSGVPAFDAEARAKAIAAALAALIERT